jgi:polar amino acid transport system substrate-binding protein
MFLIGLLPAASRLAWATPQSWRFATDSNDRSGLAPAGRAVLKRAFERLGLGLVLEFEPLPLRRSLRLTELGQLDGEPLRIASIVDQRPQLLLVPVAISRVEVWGYVTDAALQPHDMAELRPLRVAHQRGILLLEQLLGEVARRVEATTPEDVLRLLRLRVVDVGVLTLASGQAPLRPAQLEGLVPLTAPLHSSALYPVLHRRHAQLLPALTAVLQEMESSGESDTLRRKAWADARDGAAAALPT